MRGLSPRQVSGLGQRARLRARFSRFDFAWWHCFDSHCRLVSEWSSPATTWSHCAPMPSQLGSCVVASHRPPARFLTWARSLGQSEGRRERRVEYLGVCAGQYARPVTRTSQSKRPHFFGARAMVSPPAVVMLGRMWPFKRRRAIEPDPEGFDLRSFPSVRVRVKGTVIYVPDELRANTGGTAYVLRREPDNDVDPMAIEVLWRKSKVGYVSASRAGLLAPLLDELGDHDFVVSGAGAVTNSIRLWVDLPRIPELRAFVRAARQSSSP